MKSMKVIPGIHLLSSFLGAGVWGANVYLLEDNDLTLVDTGFIGRSGQILRKVADLGYAPSDITRIIITHYHADHIGSLAMLKKVTQAKVLAHPADAPYINGRLPEPGAAGPKWLGRSFTHFRRLWSAIATSVDVLVNEGDELPVLGGIKILHTPGHTCGSISLFCPSRRLIIVGDVIAHRFGLRLPSKTFTEDIAQEISSVRRIASLDFDVVCFGHGSPLRHGARNKVSDFARGLSLPS